MTGGGGDVTGAARLSLLRSGPQGSVRARNSAMIARTLQSNVDLTNAFSIGRPNIPGPPSAQSTAQQRTNKHANVLAVGVSLIGSDTIGATTHVES